MPFESLNNVFCNHVDVDDKGKIKFCINDLNLYSDFNIFCEKHFKKKYTFKNYDEYYKDLIQLSKKVYLILQKNKDQITEKKIVKIIQGLSKLIDNTKHKHIIDKIKCNCREKDDEKKLNSFKFCFNHLIEILENIYQIPSKSKNNITNEFDYLDDLEDFYEIYQDIDVFKTTNSFECKTNHNINLNTNQSNTTTRKENFVKIEIEEIRKSYTDKTENCPVCFCDLNDEKEPLKCGHWVHMECVNKWKETQKLNKPKCPVCRQDLDQIKEKKEKIVYISIEKKTTLHEGSYILIQGLHKTLSNMCHEGMNKLHQMDVKQIIPKVVNYLLDR